jgi:hypothetical protein
MYIFTASLCLQYYLAGQDPVKHFLDGFSPFLCGAPHLEMAPGFFFEA